MHIFVTFLNTCEVSVWLLLTRGGGRGGVMGEGGTDKEFEKTVFGKPS